MLIPMTPDQIATGFVTYAIKPVRGYAYGYHRESGGLCGCALPIVYLEQGGRFDDKATTDAGLWLNTIVGALVGPSWTAGLTTGFDGAPAQDLSAYSEDSMARYREGYEFGKQVAALVFVNEEG